MSANSLIGRKVIIDQPERMCIHDRLVGAVCTIIDDIDGNIDFKADVPGPLGTAVWAGGPSDFANGYLRLLPIETEA